MTPENTYALATLGDVYIDDPAEPVTIICGTPRRNIAFMAEPSDGTISVRATGYEWLDEMQFGTQEFALIASLLLTVAEAN